MSPPAQTTARHVAHLGSGCARRCLTVRPSTNTLPAFVADDLIIQSIQQVHRRVVVPKTSFLRRRRRPPARSQPPRFPGPVGFFEAGRPRDDGVDQGGGGRPPPLPLLGAARRAIAQRRTEQPAAQAPPIPP